MCQVYAKYAKSFSDTTLLTPHDNPVMEMLLSPSFTAVRKQAEDGSQESRKEHICKRWPQNAARVCELPGLGGHTSLSSSLAGVLWRVSPTISPLVPNGLFWGYSSF